MHLRGSEEKRKLKMEGRKKSNEEEKKVNEGREDGLKRIKKGRRKTK